MKLGDYLAKRKESITAFAVRSGISKATAYRIAKTGTRNPSRDVIEKIVAASDGLVSANDLLGLATTKPRPKRKRAA